MAAAGARGRLLAVALAAALALSLSNDHAAAQTHRDSGGTVLPGVVPLRGVAP